MRTVCPHNQSAVSFHHKQEIMMWQPWSIILQNIITDRKLMSSTKITAMFSPKQTGIARKKYNKEKYWFLMLHINFMLFHLSQEILDNKLNLWPLFTSHKLWYQFSSTKVCPSKTSNDQLRQPRRAIEDVGGFNLRDEQWNPCLNTTLNMAHSS